MGIESRGILHLSASESRGYKQLGERYADHILLWPKVRQGKKQRNGPIVHGDSESIDRYSEVCLCGLPQRINPCRRWGGWGTPRGQIETGMIECTPQKQL